MNTKRCDTALSRTIQTKNFLYDIKKKYPSIDMDDAISCFRNLDYYIRNIRKEEEK